MLELAGKVLLANGVKTKSGNEKELTVTGSVHDYKALCDMELLGGVCVCVCWVIKYSKWVMRR